ncbi:MAG: GIY-YIG nuclease family protein [Metamycoplasmataceae bacterium]
MNAIIIVIICLLITIISVFLFLKIKQEIELKARINGMIQNQQKTDAKTFLRDYKLLADKKKGRVSKSDASGIYVLYNRTKALYYVGQSKNVLKRVRSHLTGSGNGNVYADFKYGDDFEVVIHKCHENELNLIERRFIAEYNASGSHGYNKTRGNK